MGLYKLYRNSEFFREEALPGEIHHSFCFRHKRPYPVMLDSFDPMMAIEDAIEIFHYDRRTGNHVSQNFAQLPSWVHRQELRQHEERQRRERFDRLTRMMLQSKFPDQG